MRAAVLTDRAVSYGVGVPPDAPYLVEAALAGLATVRRSTGGTGVLHGPGDLAWAVVLPREDPRVGSDYVHAYPRLGAGVVRFLAERGVRATWGDPPGSDPDYCLLSDRGSVLSTRGKVIGGAAQHVNSRALLHSGIVPLELDRPMLRTVFHLSPKSVERLTSLRELAVEGTSESLAWKLAAHLSDALAGK